MPVDTSWADATQAAADALATLRLKPGDIDEQRIARHALEAEQIIGSFLDRHEVDDDHPAIDDPAMLAALRSSHCALTVELYLRKDAPFGIFDAFDQDASSYRIAADPLRGLRTALSPMKARWGVA